MNEDLGVMIAIPPTANHIWQIFQNRMHPSTTYRKWLQHCTDLVLEELEPVIWPADVTITIRLGKGFSKSRDLDNCIKPCIDLLKPPKFHKDGKLKSAGAGILKDDSIEHLRSVRIRPLPPHDGKSEAECYVLVAPSEISIEAPKAERKRRVS